MSNRTASSFGIAVMLVAAGLSAQTRTGTISGTVRDATSQVLPGVSITLEGPTLVTAQVTASSDTGLYRFINLPPGTYDVRAELSGFQSLTLQGIRVDIGRNTPVSVFTGMGPGLFRTFPPGPSRDDVTCCRGQR